jgi:hypothetical protein
LTTAAPPALDGTVRRQIQTLQFYRAIPAALDDLRDVSYIGSFARALEDAIRSEVGAKRWTDLLQLTGQQDQPGPLTTAKLDDAEDHASSDGKFFSLELLRLLGQLYMSAHELCEALGSFAAVCDHLLRPFHPWLEHKIRELAQTHTLAVLPATANLFVHHELEPEPEPHQDSERLRPEATRRQKPHPKDGISSLSAEPWFKSFVAQTVKAVEEAFRLGAVRVILAGIKGDITRGQFTLREWPAMLSLVQQVSLSPGTLCCCYLCAVRSGMSVADCSQLLMNVCCVVVCACLKPFRPSKAGRLREQRGKTSKNNEKTLHTSASCLIRLRAQHTS